ncbi:hypothetical protein [Arthrobacter sp. efr-133-TYG-120]|uniref:hypothetical protein n=1 Tax=Arthrobacter sp. efr-133-TYG-120 TaxID=3040280 RepID=UPI00254E362C|nr:hypothetical protein [Arthrobacter sp. efr-133-TYG-120]
MESKRYWRFRAFSKSSRVHLTEVGVGAMSRLTEFSSLLSLGGRSLAGAALLLMVPLAAILVTQSVTGLQGQLHALSGSVPEWFRGLGHWLTSPVPSGVDPAALPTAAISVAGIFVAVYFATVTFVVSTSYRDATRKLRDQIVRQPESRWYVVFFTQAVVYTAFALGLKVAGFDATHLTLVVSGLSAALVVLSFGRIWVTLFVLLEPTSLFPQIRRNLNRWTHRAYLLGNRKSTSDLRIRRANEKIRDNLDALDDLVTLILDREHERAGDRGIEASYDPRIGVAVRHLRLVWEGYARRKHIVRALPDWSPTRLQAKDWFLSSHSEVGIALATGTTLAASEVVDELWFERRIANLIERLLTARDIRSLESALRGLPPFSRIIGTLGQFEELRLWITSTTFAPMTILSNYALERGSIDLSTARSDPVAGHLSREQHFALPGEVSAHNLADFVLLEALDGCLGYIDYFKRMKQVLAGAATLIVNDTRQPAAGKTLLQILSDLRMALATEMNIEGERVTPDNALRQLVARVLASETMDELEQLLTFLENEIWPWVLDLGKSKTWAAGAALSRAFELTQKLETTLQSAGKLLATCESSHLERDDRWPDTNIDAIKARSQTLGNLLELPIARLAATVDSTPKSDSPDHFGWAYYTAHENLVRRVLDRDPGDLGELQQKVSLLYWTGDLATRRLLATVRRHDQGVINSYVSEPYVRFMQLSGIALVLSKVTQNDGIFAPFGTRWSQLLSNADQATQILGRAAATLSSESSVYSLTPGRVERTNIENRANQILDQLGVPRRLFDLGGFGDQFVTSSSLPPLGEDALRLLRAVRLGHFEGMFYARWLRPQAIGKGAAAPSGVEQYLRHYDLDKEGSDG